MKKFLINIIIIFAVVTMLYGLISFVVNKPPDVKNDYLAAMIDKHERLDQIRQPKLILAGCSNLAFSVDSKKIQDSLKVPVVNLGLIADLGLDFILEELKFSAKENDVIIISTAYFLNNGEYEIQKLTASFYPEAHQFFKKSLKNEMICHVDKTRYNLKNFSHKIDNDSANIIYNRKGFNAFGDNESHLDKKLPDELEDRRYFRYYYWQGIDKLNEFRLYMKEKNITVLFSYPPYPALEFDKNIKVIEHLEKDIHQGLQVERLNQPEDCVYPDSLFFDTIYHLNKDGREIHTTKLIQMLRDNPKAMSAIDKIRTTE